MPGWVCRVWLGVAGVSRVCLGVSRVCRLGVLRECRRRVPAGCVAGACRVCQGCVGGVCARADGSGVPRGPRLPPPPLGPCPFEAACVLDAGLCAWLRLPLFPRGLPLFRVRSSRPQGVAPPSPRDTRATAFRRPLGTCPPFPRGLKETQDTRASAFRRATRTALLFAVAVLRHRRPHRTATPHTSHIPKFHPPRKKHPPAPRGPSTQPGMDVGRPPRCVRARQASTSGTAGLSRIFVCVFRGLPDCAAPRRRQQAPCTALPIKARCVSAAAHGRRRRPRV